MPIIAKIAAAAVVVTVGAGVAMTSFDDDYQVRVVLDSALNVVEGGPVLMNGFEAGTVNDISTEDGRAVVTIDLKKDFAPIHEGAVVNVTWKAVLSERRVEITNGPDSNTEVPDGGLIPGNMPKPVELDDVLSSLDTPTRAHISRLIGRAQDALDGREQDANDSIRTAGPALLELGNVLKALGTDGPAIRNLVTRMNDMMTVVDRRQGNVNAIIADLDQLTSQIAAQREGLSASLDDLPSTLEQATQVLAQVPSTVDAARPLLAELEPATARLGPAAADLAPLLRDLRPLAADLRPTLGDLSTLLSITPGLLTQTDALLPLLNTAVDSAETPVGFARPYTPEIQGVVSTWNSAFSNYDANGNFARIFIQEGPSSLNENPGILPPGVSNDPYPAPGAVVAQPWTDAHGSELR